MGVLPHDVKPDPPLDLMGRLFSRLSLSVTRTCNLRCRYCMPQSRRVLGENRVLRLDEIHRLVGAFAEMGVDEIRLTGGEPTLRPDFIGIARKISSDPRIVTIGLATNGCQLAKNATAWREAGINSLNLGLDTLNRERFQKITGYDGLPDILTGLEAALDAGYKSVRLNVVLLKDINEDELGDYLDLAARRSVNVRFIELMRTAHNEAFFKQHHMSVTSITQRLERLGWSRLPPSLNSGPFQVYSHPERVGTSGLVTFYSHDFCRTCNRLWVTAAGELRFCLFGDTSVALRHLLQDDNQNFLLRHLISSQLYLKPFSTFFEKGDQGAASYLFPASA